MTLILSLATPDYCVQVSDRLVTDLHSGKRIRQFANKMVFFRNSLAFGFTGLAELEGQHTDIWLAETIIRSPTGTLRETCIYIAKRAAQALLRPEVRNLDRELKGLAFVGVGFTFLQSGGPWIPLMVRISNFHYPDGRRCIPRLEFSASAVFLSPPGPVWGWLETPNALGGERIAYVQRVIRRCMRLGTGPGPVIRMFAAAIRDVAKTNSRVGDDLLAGTIPRVSMSEHCRLASAYQPGGVSEYRDVLSSVAGPNSPSVFLDMRADGNYNFQTAPIMAIPGSPWLISNMTINYG